ncbi:TPR repeat-containing protein [Pirellula staleyi DSM 6068]|uniref:TPR repeat-containing protein n=1 Tax=Pirellula staleyi (strain ATCC 27377 / DSM 6068 / ICPB 4128) TaxID=530564 RepID=D2QXE4_PIRSD|nr:TPR repeat-containing protein [Pirellula staleyi DSM 6068]
MVEPPAVSSATKRPALETLYHHYLESENSAEFIRSVSSRYMLCTLERLARYGDHVSKRAAVMSLGYLGDFRHNATLGRALHDRDRAVRLLADNGIRQLWFRDGNTSQRQRLEIVSHLNASNHHQAAYRAASELIEEAPWLAETWNQRGIALFGQERFEDAANDCHQTLELNPYHFGAAVGMAHCYLEMEDPLAALECFRRAVKLNPDLEEVRAQIDYLERSLEER